ncbi:LysR family transcriptional regulator [Pseudorhodobacter turbinis]|uniref:LysR family transcriptional regulator n=1 Tax=Pseudorhodobacter turbinis TaxID=2500533 RepID=A0A4P8EG57_9RHOB|nr:LysR family transcriptional regulator [Pseudorhodobacter turbinis]QCO55495.1 LysR family transcriptional regulator [Pseudorhodobacter turbinis]
MKIQNLKTLVAVSENRSFVEAGEVIGLSHSAVSLHIKALEDELGVLLFDRKSRPPTITGKGVELVLHARKLLTILDEISGLSSQENLMGSLTVGVIHSALINLVPPALASLRHVHPKLSISLTKGGSKDLTDRVRRQELDVAIVAEPDNLIDDLEYHPVCVEPMFLLMPSFVLGRDVRTILSTHPYIWYDRTSWTGSQIQRYLQSQKISVQDGVEIDSLEAVEQLVRHGLGVSIAPKSTCGIDDFCDEIRVVPLDNPQPVRNIVMISRKHNPREKLAQGLLIELQKPKPEQLTGNMIPLSECGLKLQRPSPN